MSIKLIPPGKRHGNKVYYAEIKVKGRRAEISTKTRNAKFAREYAESFEAELWKRHFAGRGETDTVQDAIERYIAFRRPRAQDRKWLDAIRMVIGETLVSDVNQHTFDQTAQFLYPGRAPETWNRQVYTPLQAALRHSGVNLMIRRPRMNKPRQRALSRDLAQLLIDGTNDADLKALLALLFYSGCRIGEAIAITPDRVDLQGLRICFDMSKTDRDHWRPLHKDAAQALSALPPRSDRIFRWKTTSGPRKPLRVLCKKLGVRMTPHDARHSFATWLTEEGASLRDLMDAGGWNDVKSVMRYVGGDVERVRKVVDKL